MKKDAIAPRDRQTGVIVVMVREMYSGMGVQGVVGIDTLD
jgi:hypothetical protein